MGLIKHGHSLTSFRLIISTCILSNLLVPYPSTQAVQTPYTRSGQFGSNFTPNNKPRSDPNGPISPHQFVVTRSVTDDRPQSATGRMTQSDEFSRRDCREQLCFSLPMACDGPTCKVMLLSKLQSSNLNRPASESRDIAFELISRTNPTDSYAAVGFSPSGRMEGLVTECVHYRDSTTGARVAKLANSFNLGGTVNVPVTILSGIRVVQETSDDEIYRCAWIASSGVEFKYEDLEGNQVIKREDLAFKQYFILLASGDLTDGVSKLQHSLRESSSTAVSLSQTLGQLKSSGSHILIRIHGSLLVVIWAGLVTTSIIIARYYKNTWHNSKLNNLAIWFVIHRTFMTTSWFGTLIAIIFSYMYVEGYHFGVHQICGSACLILSTIQILTGLARPSLESDKRIYFNWAHFMCGNLSHTLAMVCLITASFLPPAHLPPIYLWIIVSFIALYALTHIVLTVHQYMIHTTSKVSITPMRDLSSESSGTRCRSGSLSDSYLTKQRGSFRKFMLGIFVTLTVAFLGVVIILINNRLA